MPVTLLASCSNSFSEKQIIGKWEDKNIQTYEYENGETMTVKTDLESTYFANGKSNSMGTITITTTTEGHMAFHAIFSGNWEIRDDVIYETLTNAHLDPTEADDMKTAKEKAAIFGKGAKGQTIGSKILELTNDKFLVEDIEDGAQSVYHRID